MHMTCLSITLVLDTRLVPPGHTTTVEFNGTGVTITIPPNALKSDNTEGNINIHNSSILVNVLNVFNLQLTMQCL